jgi:uncharacterized membrane-anchored protein
MNQRIRLAVALQVLIMIGVLVPPLAVMYTGTTVYLETEGIDPRALLRGDYAILGYRVGRTVLSPAEAEAARTSGRLVFVVVTTDRPARFVSAAFTRPRLGPGEACLVGRSRGDGSIDFPQIAQYFVPEGQGRAIEAQRGEGLLARISVTDRCNAVLTGLEVR